MRKAAGAVAAAFALGTGVVAMMGVGMVAGLEAGVLGAVGLALYGSSMILNGRETAPTGGVAKEA